MSAGPEILRLRNAAISRPGCFAWNRGNDDPLFFTPCFDRLPFYPKSFLPLVRQRRVIPPGTRTAYSKGYISSLVGHSVFKVHGPDCRQSARTRRGRCARAAWRRVEMCLNLSNAIKLTRNNQKAVMREGAYREGTYIGEMRFSAMMGRGKLRSGRQGRSFRSKRGSTSRNQPRKVWQQR